MDGILGGHLAKVRKVLLLQLRTYWTLLIVKRDVKDQHNNNNQSF